MKLTVLGFWGGTPYLGRGTSGYLLQSQSVNLLLDCGSGVLTELTKHFSLDDIDLAVISHLHFDHTADLGILQFFLKRAFRNDRTTPMPLFIPNEPEGTWQLYNHEVFAPTFLSNGLTHQYEHLTFEFLAVDHTIPCYAIKISDGEKTFVYSADTYYYEPLVNFTKGADLFLCEATIVEGSNHTSGKGHMNGFEAGAIAEASKVKHLVLTHLPNDGDLNRIAADARQSFSGEITLASEQTVYEI